MNWRNTLHNKCWAVAMALIGGGNLVSAQVAAVPDREALSRPFVEQDRAAFRQPEKIYYPETWFHYIGGNVALEGITADLEAIASAGVSGVQLFHGQFGGEWPEVDSQIACLSPLWESAVRHTAEECRRLGLRLTMQNCPGWAMSGGPWIAPSNAMRHLVYSRTDVQAIGEPVTVQLPVPQPSAEEWRDYRDVTVLAFPTPLGDTGKPLQPIEVKGSDEEDWQACLTDPKGARLKLSPAEENTPHWVEVRFPEETVIRTLELPAINSMNSAWVYEPGVKVRLLALPRLGNPVEVASTDLPQSNWQDDSPFTMACQEVSGADRYRLEIINAHNINLQSIRFYSGARKNSWESEAGWTLRSIDRSADGIWQSPLSYVKASDIQDITGSMQPDGSLCWNAPKAGSWTILRIGHVNTGMKNAPAPPEGTGWECDKLSESGPNAHFAGYIGKLATGALQGGLLNGMLLDSWECKTQTWTPAMEQEFQRVSGYALRRWLPAVFGYVVDDPETTDRFLLDWRQTIDDLYVNKFFGRMATLAKEQGLSIAYETASGDVFPTDIMKFFKYADVPMCEFWQPTMTNYVGSLNFKPIKPTASAARLYGKPRVAAESFTSFALTWDEHWSMLKEIANFHFVEGVTHNVFHTYTHNPQVGFLPPGTSFGSLIGTPFLRGQTWWKHMPELTGYLARCGYLLERGVPVSDVLWYLGDEMNHKPDQQAAFPAGYKYDYCNPDVLLNRLSVQEGHLVTPEGLSYRLLWMPDTERMLPATLKKLLALVEEGAIVVGNAPKGIATLSGGEAAEQEFQQLVRQLWGDQPAEIRTIGKGKVLANCTLEEALRNLHMEPDVKGEGALWTHRRTNGADWYFVCTPIGEAFQGTLAFRAVGSVELWDPVTGESRLLSATQQGDYTQVELSLPEAGSCFVVFNAPGKADQTKDVPALTKQQVLEGKWTLAFPDGWGTPRQLKVKQLRPWCDLLPSAEGKAFSGTVTYTTTFPWNQQATDTPCWLDLGEVDMIAAVTLNGKKLRTLWCAPYAVDLSSALRKGKNELTIEVTSTWFNRLVYDAGLPEAERKTWTISGPKANAPLRKSGLMGPVVLKYGEY